MRKNLARCSALLVIAAQACARAPAPAPERTGGVGVPARAVAVVAPEDACVHDAESDAAHRILERHASELGDRLDRPAALEDVANPHCLSTTSLGDVDGDGIDDADVSEGCSWGTVASLHLLYFSRGGCPAFAGELVDGELRPLEARTHGVQDLEATWSNGCAGNDFGWRHYRWDGKAYAVADEARCELCPDAPAAPGANAHPTCRRARSAR